MSSAVGTVASTFAAAGASAFAVASTRGLPGLNCKANGFTSDELYSCVAATENSGVSGNGSGDRCATSGDAPGDMHKASGEPCSAVRKGAVSGRATGDEAA